MVSYATKDINVRIGVCIPLFLTFPENDDVTPKHVVGCNFMYNF